MNRDRRDHMKMDVSIVTGVIIVRILGLLAIRVDAHAQEITKSDACAEVEVRSIKVSFELERDVLLATTPAKIEIAPRQISETTPGAARREVTVIVLGPVLGSMDSHDVKTDLSCTGKKLVLMATITRSADYHGAVLANIIWRPRIQIVLVLRRPEVSFKAIWRMCLTTGAELDHAQTSPYPDQKYPIALTKAIR
jgi:hypothetical protein